MTVNVFTSHNNVRDSACLAMQNVEGFVLLLTAGIPVTTESVEIGVLATGSSVMEHVQKNTKLVEKEAVYKNQMLKNILYAEHGASIKVTGQSLTIDHAETPACTGKLNLYELIVNLNNYF